MAGETGASPGIETEPNPLIEWAGTIGVAGIISWWVRATVLGLMCPSYNTVNDPISLLAGVGAPHAGFQQLNFYIFGESIPISTVGPFVWSDRGWRLLVGILFLVRSGTGVIWAGHFQFAPSNLEDLDHVVGTQSR